MQAGLGLCCSQIPEDRFSHVEVLICVGFRAHCYTSGYLDSRVLKEVKCSCFETWSPSSANHNTRCLPLSSAEMLKKPLGQNV